MIPVGAIVSLFTDRGTFATDGPGQSVSADLKTITGPLDGTGKLTVYFQGRPPAIGGGSIVLPAPAELGIPSMVATAPDGTAFPLNSDNVSTLPQLIGPPHQIVMTVVNPVNPVNQYFATTLPDTPWAYQNQTLTVSAKVYDLINQPVLENMPLWFGQIWTQTDPNGLNDPSYIPTVAYDESTVSYAYINNALIETDNTGSVNNVGFGSDHSGKYTLECFALIPGADTDTLTNYFNINPSLDNGLIWDYVLANTLTTDSTLTTPVSTSQDIWIDTYVAFNTNTEACGWGNPVITISNNVSYWTPSNENNWDPPLGAGINCDGSESAKVTVTGTDFDGKLVIPGTPYKTWASIWVDMPQFTPTLMQMAALYQDGGVNGGVSITSETQLYFNDLSQADVICKGNGPIGEVAFSYDNTNPDDPSVYSLGNVMYMYGPDPSNVANLLAPISVTVNNLLIAGGDIMITPPTNPPTPGWAVDSSKLNIPVFTNGGQPFPDGYVLVLNDNGANGSWPMGPPVEGILTDGTLSLNYAWELNGTTDHITDWSITIYAYLDGQGLVMLPPILLPINPATDPPVTVIRPVNATVAPNYDIYVKPSDTVPFTMAVTDYAGHAVAAGYDILFGVGNGAMGTVGVTDLNGNVTIPFACSAQIGIYSEGIAVECAMQSFDLLNVTNTPNGAQGLSANIHVGFQPPNVEIDPAGVITSTTIPIIIVDPNIAVGSFPTDYIVEYSTDGKTWTKIPNVTASGQTNTSYTIIGLKPKTAYQIQVIADTPVDYLGADDPSLPGVPASATTPAAPASATTPVVP